MASRATFTAVRFLTSIRTTGPLRPPTGQMRTLTTYPGLLGAAKMQPVAELHNPEEAISFLGCYEEALERWQQEAQLMRDIRILPEDLEFSSKIEDATRDQLRDLLEAVATEEVLDIRRGWIVTANY